MCLDIMGKMLSKILNNREVGIKWNVFTYLKLHVLISYIVTLFFWFL